MASDKIKIPDSFAQSPNGYSEQYWIALPNGAELYVDDFGDFKQYYADVGEDSGFPFVMIGASNDETGYKFTYIDPKDSQVEMGRPKLTPGRTVSEKKDMSKKYTKRQIREAIAYWERRLRKMNESAGNAIVVPDENDQQQAAAFEKQLNGLFGGDAYGSLLDSDKEVLTTDDGGRYAVSPQDLVSSDDFWNFVYDRLNEGFDPGQEIAADEMKKLVEGWVDEMYRTAEENFEGDPDYLADYDDGPDPGDWDNGYLYSDRDRDYYPSR